MSLEPTQDSTDFQQRYEQERRARLAAESIAQAKQQECEEVQEELSALKAAFEQLVDQRTQALIDARDTALANAKMKSEFLANMSHEIRTPLNGMLGMLQALEQCENPSKSARLVSTARESGQLLIAIINDILELTKIETAGITLEKRPINLSDTVEKVLQNFSMAAHQKNINLVSDISLFIPLEVEGDAYRIQQVLGNFINNAIKFTESGEKMNGEVVVSLYQTTPGVFDISVRDTGIGMTEKQRNNVFNAFTQGDTSTTRKYGGTGLGLCIASKLVQTMGAEIKVESKLNEGSLFSISLQLPVLRKENLAMSFEDASKEALVYVVSKCKYRGKAMLTRFDELGIKEKHLAVNLSDINTSILNDHKEQVSYIFLDFDDTDPAVINLCENIKVQFPQVFIIHLAPYHYDKKIPDFIDKRIFKPIQQVDLIHLSASDSLEQSIFAPRKSSNRSFSGKKVLVVDDNEINILVAIELFGELGFDIDTATNGQEAVNAVKANEYDLVLMDIQMPVKDGLQACKEIRSFGGRHSQLPILAMTANAMQEDKEKSAECGMNDHISKPLDLTVLLPKFEFYLNDNLCFTHAITLQNNHHQEDALPLIQGFDLNESLNRFVGNKEKLVSLLNNFAVRHHDADNEMQNYIAEHAWKAAEDLAHKLKGTSGNLGITVLYHAASTLEAAIKNQHFDSVSSLFVDFKDAIRQMNRGIEKINEFNMVNTGENTTTDELDKSLYLKLLNDLLVNIENDLGSASTSIDALKRLAKNTDEWENITKLNNQFQSFDIPNMKSNILRIQKSLT